MAGVGSENSFLVSVFIKDGIYQIDCMYLDVSRWEWKWNGECLPGARLQLAAQSGWSLPAKLPSTTASMSSTSPESSISSVSSTLSVKSTLS